MLNYNELTLQELKREAKKLGIEVSNKDTKVILIDKIKEHLTKDVKRTSKLLDVRQKMSKTKKVIVTKLNPEDIVRDSILVTIINSTGSYSCAVPFNVKVKLPEPVIQNLKEKKYQGWRHVEDKLLGGIDNPILLPEFSVQEVSN